MRELYSYLREKSYPGRGIFMGRTAGGKNVAAYFIMGRSVNSRNRVFVREGDVLRTKAADESRMSDPSLIIYAPVRKVGDALIVTNGDQTDTVEEFLLRGESFEAALMTREYEPDAPNFTPRISGMMTEQGYELSILKEESGMPARHFFNYGYKAGEGHIIHTYVDDGAPLPPYAGEPALLSLEGEGCEIAQRLWAALDSENRVSLYVNAGGEVYVINAMEEVK